MTVKKGNRIKQVDEIGLPKYLKMGYEEINEKGEVISRATGGKTISVAQFNKVMDKLDQLEKENAELKKEVKSLKKG